MTNCHRTNSNTALCRICFMGEESGKLAKYCRCSGSIKFCHQNCLMQWAEQRGIYACELCDYRFQLYFHTSRINQWHCPPIQPMQYLFLVTYIIAWLVAGGSIFWLFYIVYNRVATTSSSLGMITSMMYGIIALSSITIILCETIFVIRPIIAQFIVYNRHIEIVAYDPIHDSQNFLNIHNIRNHNTRNSEGINASPPGIVNTVPAIVTGECASPCYSEISLHEPTPQRMYIIEDYNASTTRHLEDEHSINIIDNTDTQFDGKVKHTVFTTNTNHQGIEQLSFEPSLYSLVNNNSSDSSIGQISNFDFIPYLNRSNVNLSSTYQIPNEISASHINLMPLITSDPNHVYIYGDQIIHINSSSVMHCPNLQEPPLQNEVLNPAISPDNIQSENEQMPTVEDDPEASAKFSIMRRCYSDSELLWI